MNHPISKICDSSLCTGCGACYNICPKEAIDMQLDKFGYLHPRINPSLCIGCKRCLNACHVLTPLEKNEIIRTFAAISKDEIVYKNSSSGGFATTLAHYIIDNGGVVYGASFDESFNLRHVRISNVNDLVLIQGSKYVESNIIDCYKQIEEDVRTRATLFIGTPCQVAGVSSYFNKLKTTNLYTLSFICGGVSSTQFLKDAIGTDRFKNLKKIEFRRGGETAIWLSYKDKKEKKLSFYLNPYVVGYYCKLTERTSCFNCQYASLDRIGDITCGDFWGLKTGRFKGKLKTGVSIVLSTTKRGDYLLDMVKDCFHMEEHSIDETLNSNQRLISSSIPHSSRENFCTDYLKKGFNQSVIISMGYKFWLKRILIKAYNDIKQIFFIKR